MSRNPYHAENAQPILKRSVLAYFDILGYINLVKNAYASNKQAQTLVDLYGALNSGRDGLLERQFGEEFNRTFKKDRYAVKAFTDNIAIGWPIHDDAESELADAMMKLMDFQFHMTVAGFFVRGGIAIGDAYVDDVAVFGQALLEAHQVESTTARDPRIVMAPSALEALKLHMTYYGNSAHAPQLQMLLRDADGQVFLNYLQILLYSVEDTEPDYDALSRHKKVVEAKLIEFKPQPSVWSKYVWVAGYHNYFCEAYSHLFDDEYKIDLQLFSAPPGPIVDFNATQPVTEPPPL